jgi:hypothetical protein
VRTKIILTELTELTAITASLPMSIRNAFGKVDIPKDQGIQQMAVGSHCVCVLQKTSAIAIIWRKLKSFPTIIYSAHSLVMVSALLVLAGVGSGMPAQAQTEPSGTATQLTKIAPDCSNVPESLRPQLLAENICQSAPSQPSSPETNLGTPSTGACGVIYTDLYATTAPGIARNQILVYSTIGTVLQVNTWKNSFKNFTTQAETYAVGPTVNGRVYGTNFEDFVNLTTGSGNVKVRNDQTIVTTTGGACIGFGATDQAIIR